MSHRGSTIAESLAAVAVDLPSMTAVIDPSGSLTYRQLHEDSARCAAGLAALGLRKGDRVALLVRPGTELMVLAYGMFKLGLIPVLVDPGIGRDRLADCLREAAPRAFVGTPLADWARWTLGWARDSIELAVVVGRPGVPGSIPLRKVISPGQSRPLPAVEVGPDDAAAIAFTSGSTGPPKGVVFTQGMFEAQAELLRESFEIQRGETHLATFPLFGLFDAALEMTTVFPRMDFTRPSRVKPSEIIGPIQRLSITHMFGSPALLDRVGTFGSPRGIRLPTLRRVLSAGAPVSDATLNRFARLLAPGVSIHTPYGATEALPVASISHQERQDLGGPSEGRGVCVGRPLKGVRVEVLPISDEAIPGWTPGASLPPEEVGELTVWGDNVSREYYGRPEANAQAKVADDHGRIGHRMGDLGYLDRAGRVWFCGRKAHRVVTDSGTLYSVPCEGVFNAHPEVYRTALVGLGQAPHQRPVICVELEKGVSRRRKPAIRRELLELAGRVPMTSGIDQFLFHPGFPVDIRHNAKIFREKLAEWAREQSR